VNLRAIAREPRASSPHGSCDHWSVNRYDEIFSTQPGRCFRYVEDEGGRPVSCPAPVEWRGHFQPPKGTARLVTACDAHSGGLYRPDPLPVRR